MTSLLWKTVQLKDVTDIPLIAQSSENLASCLNGLLKAGAFIASRDLGSGFQEQVFKMLNLLPLGKTIQTVIVLALL